MTVKKEYETIKQALIDDFDYAWSWHSNIAMVIQDSGNDYNASNLLASKIMKRIWDIDTSENPRYLEMFKKKTCSSKVDGICPLPNIYCKYPECEK
jgi:hypothetical protein